MSTLEVRTLSVEVGGSVVIRDLSFALHPGDKVGLVGRNGAGKTTTLKILAGEELPASGTVEVRGRVGYLRQDPRQHRADDDATGLEHILAARGLVELARRLEKVRIQLEEDPSERNIGRFTRLEDEYRAGGGYQAESEAHAITAGLGLASDRLGLPVGALSGGERRRLEIARSLTLQPSFILLDEPFSGIDTLTVKDLQEIIRELSRAGIGVLVTDHNVRETLNVTDRAYILNHGKIFRAGTPEVLSADPEVRRVYLGEHFRLN